MGVCLCPRCLIPKSRVHQIATERDMLQQMFLQCCDTKEQRDKVVATSRLIYEKQYGVHTSQVKELLKSESLVPTLVSILFHNEIQSQMTNIMGRMPFQKGSASLPLICSIC